jgi:hypothetical protein
MNPSPPEILRGWEGLFKDNEAPAGAVAKGATTPSDETKTKNDSAILRREAENTRDPFRSVGRGIPKYNTFTKNVELLQRLLSHSG